MSVMCGVEISAVPTGLSQVVHGTPGVETPGYDRGVPPGHPVILNCQTFRLR